MGREFLAIPGGFEWEKAQPLLPGKSGYVRRIVVVEAKFCACS